MEREQVYKRFDPSGPDPGWNDDEFLWEVGLIWGFSEVAGLERAREGARYADSSEPV